MENKIFLNDKEEQIPYDGSGVKWRVSAYAVIERDKKFLMCRRDELNRWMFPDGGIDNDESIKEALKRESLEEVGADVEMGRFIGMMDGWFYLTDEKQFYHTIRLFYKANIVGGMGKPSDKKIGQVKFISMNDVNDVEFQDAVRYVKELI